MWRDASASRQRRWNVSHSDMPPAPHSPVASDALTKCSTSRAAPMGRHDHCARRSHAADGLLSAGTQNSVMSAHSSGDTVTHAGASPRCPGGHSARQNSTMNMAAHRDRMAQKPSLPARVSTLPLATRCPGEVPLMNSMRCWRYTTAFDTATPMVSSGALICAPSTVTLGPYTSFSASQRNPSFAPSMVSTRSTTAPASGEPTQMKSSANGSRLSAASRMSAAMPGAPCSSSQSAMRWRMTRAMAVVADATT